MCVVQKEGEATICYGAPRADVEKILGAGEVSDSKITLYSDGVGIMYREDAVAAITLSDGSKGKFKTARGAEIGMTKEKMKNMYGEKYAIDMAPLNLDYAYNTKSKKFISESELSEQKEQDLLETYMISAMFTDEGNARSIMLLDRKMGLFFS